MITEQNLATLENVWATDGELALSAEAEHDLRTEDYVMEMQQSGERVVGRDSMRAMQQAFPNPRDGRIARETRFYASPFEPPRWRAQWVERT